MADLKPAPKAKPSLKAEAAPKRERASKGKRASKPKSRSGCITCEHQSFVQNMKTRANSLSYQASTYFTFQLSFSFPLTSSCRVRRVKCDETKPICHRCQSFGVLCDGYGYSATVPPQAKLKFQMEFMMPGSSSLPARLKTLPQTLQGISEFMQISYRWNPSFLSESCYNELITLEHSASSQGALHSAIYSRRSRGSILSSL